MSDPDRSTPEQSDASRPSAADEPWNAIIGGEARGRSSEPEREATAASADAAPTEVIPPVPDDSPGQDADGPVVREEAASRLDREWMGITSFVTGALLLSPVAIVLGHLGLNAAKKGRARHRSFAVAGLILGYLGLVATAVGVWLLVSERVDPAQIDVQAQQDVTAVGAAAATHAVETGTMPQVEQTDAGYSVAGETIESHLETQHSLTFTGTSASDWCLDITYSGGDQTAVSYTATGGMALGACATE